MAVEVFKAFGVAAKNGTVSEKRIREIMMDNARELSIGNMPNISARVIDQAAPLVPHHPVSSGVAE